MTDGPINDELRGLLREAAEAHRPDRARMLARIERAAAGPARGGTRRRSTALSWPKVLLASLATAGVMAAGGLAVAAIVQPPAPQPPPTAAAAPTASATGGATGSAAPADPTPSAGPSHNSPTAPGPSSTPTRSAGASATPDRSPAPPAAGSRTEDGPLWADGSVDPHSLPSWTQSNVTLKTRQPLTALTVELRIALTAGVKDTGHWQTRPADDFTVTVREESGFLVYRWTLGPGRSLPAGEHVFAGQFNHADGGRDAKDDAYRADATAPGGPAAVWGDFARTG
ncbi:hypothetical protein [Kitasatospora sp. KL5]|uniref:hypothetical protein n=1 Tax=Kitasatospora sp. KL5 TaxID=3425125 RepID=UPI003D6E0A91